MKDKIAISKTPLRVSFVGGGTDMPYFYNKYNGATISCAINRYVYVTVKFHNNYQEKYRLNYSKTEITNSLNQIKNLRIKNVIRMLKIKKPLYINTFADIPANTGLGSSSSFTVGLIKALSELKNKKLSKKQIAEMAFRVESKITNNSLGKQDHYIAAYGGFNLITYNKKKISVKQIKLNKKKLLKFTNNIILIWTYIMRLSVNVLQDQKKNKNKNFSKLKLMNEYTNKFNKELTKKKINIIKLFEFIKKTWHIKKNLSKFITNKKIEKIIHDLSKKGFIVGKLLGAGNGGFLLALTPQKKKKYLLRNINKMKFFTFEVDQKGTLIL